MDNHQNKLLNRTEAAEWLTNEGLPIKPSYLAKLACIGGGPQYSKFGNRALYKESDLIDWGLDRLTAPLSTATAHQLQKTKQESSKPQGISKLLSSQKTSKY